MDMKFEWDEANAGEGSSYEKRIAQDTAYPHDPA